MSKDVLLIECERGNFHHVNDTSDSKEMSMQFCADMKDALIELSTLTAKVAELEKRLEVAHYNIELRTKENHDIINNHDESRWTYWRKRSGEMTDAWRDQRDLALTLTAKVKRYEDALKFYADILSWTHLKGENDFPWGRPVILYDDCGHVYPDNEWCSYGGKRARAALNQGED